GTQRLRRSERERNRAAEALKEYSEQLEEMVEQRTKELRGTQEELVKKERLSVLGQITAIVSHELRSPLGVIRSSAFYLESKLSDIGEKSTKHLKRIEEQVGHCDAIVDELLEYTRGRLSKVVEGELNPWLEEVLDQISIPGQVTLVRGLSPGLPMVSFDQEKMRRVLINLIN
ncbi:MAG: hypothetical protein LN415_10015, partial [Candidatus Thermoplasmatota archaeon]|nr:hypothetical protein [Candidatus Thermoplasmatota archaeon]